MDTWIVEIFIGYVFKKMKEALNESPFCEIHFQA